MNRVFFATLCILVLAACQVAPNEPVNPTAAPRSLTSLPPAGTAIPVAPPTPTALADGWFAGAAASNSSANCPEPYPWFFQNHAGECAAMLLNTGAAWQPFERGLMVWFQEGGLTYVLMDDGSLLKPYQIVNDPSTDPLPAPDPNILPPAGLYQPELGFAKFWRGLVPGYGWVRERLGWALAPEKPYSAFWQCNTAGDARARCYFNGPGDEIIVITRGNAPYWNYWQRAVR
jgi:hypothetical protein